MGSVSCSCSSSLCSPGGAGGISGARSGSARAEQRYRALFAHANDAILIFDPDSEVIIEANDRAAGVYGLPIADLIGRSLAEFSTDVAHGQRAVRAVLADRAEDEFRFTQRRFDSGLIDIVARASAIDYDGRRVVVTINRDVTAQRRTEEALRESEQQYREIVDTAQEGVWVLDVQARTTFVNAKMAEMLGYTRDEMLGEPPVAFMDDAARWEAGGTMGWPHVDNAGQIDIRFRRKDGTDLWAIVTTNPIFGPGGTVVGVLAMVTDITERKQSEETLQRQNAYLTALHETSLGMFNRFEIADLLETLLTKAGALLDVPDGLIFWFQNGDMGLPTRIGMGIFRGDPRLPVRRGEGLIGTVWETGEPLVLDGYQRWPKRRTGDTREYIRAAVAVPLRVGDQIIGVFSLVHQQSGRIFSEAEVQLLSHFAQLVALALDSARLYTQMQESETRYRTLIERSPAPIIVHSEERYVFANTAAVTLHGATRLDELIGKPVYDFIHPTSHALVRRRIRRSYQEGKSSGHDDATMLRLDGTSFEVEAANIPLTYEGKPATLAVMHDITARKQAEQRLRESEERYRLLFESNPLPMWVYDVETLRFLAVNDAAISHYGYTRDEFLAMTTIEIRPPEEIPAHYAFLATHSEKYQPSGVWRHRKRDGTLVDMEITSYRLEFEGRPARFVVANDVTARQRAEEALRHHALHDALTNLPNRTLFMERLERALERAKRDPDYLFAVLYLDFDRFKNVNDSLGHLSGDRLLVAAGERIGGCLRSVDTVARLGGDEFVLLLEEIADTDEVPLVARRLHDALAAPFTLRGQELVITASMGIVHGDTEYEHAADLLQDADIAMYEAKARGKARTILFDAGMRAVASERLQLENDLRRALAREELTLVYQPIVALATGEITGLEALMRWDRPTRGTVAPAAFIALAEEIGLIVPLDRWVLRAACRQMRRWAEDFPARGRLAVSVNVSGKGIAQPDFVAYVRDTLAETGLAPERLKIEITESVLIEHADAAATALWELRAIGVEAHLDDFGMGYSSLNYLHRLPITGLKIDRSFIAGHDHAGVENSDIVQAIVTLAHQLHIMVTAEGIETAEQWTQLVALACDDGQGHLFTPPLQCEMVEAFLTQGVATRMRKQNGAH